MKASSPILFALAVLTSGLALTRPAAPEPTRRAAPAAKSAPPRCGLHKPLACVKAPAAPVASSTQLIRLL